MTPSASISSAAFPPRKRRAKAAAKAAFTLVELLVVIAIMAMLALVAVPALQGLSGAGSFTSSIEQISGLLDQARSYAAAQNTYVWVAFYPVDPTTLTPASYAEPTGADQLYVVTYASTDGTNPVQWPSSSASYTIPYTPTGSTTPTLIQLSKMRLFRQVHLALTPFTSGQISSIPSTSPSSPNPAAPMTTVKFVLPLHAPSIQLGNQTSPSGASPCYVVTFSPSGSAEVAANPVSLVYVDLQPIKSAGNPSTNNLAALRINGLTGITTVYRQ